MIWAFKKKDDNLIKSRDQATLIAFIKAQVPITN